MKLIHGIDLTEEQRAEVLRAFVHRNTYEHPYGPSKPYWSSDTEWVNDHAFYIRADGKLADKPGHCEPHYMAGEE